MQAIPSYQNHVKSDIKTVKSIKFNPQSINPESTVTADSIDYVNTTYNGRREARKKKKNNKKARRFDPVNLIDLEAVADYVYHFSKCVDPEAILNIKGPFANLHYTFQVIEQSEESTESSNEQRRVSLVL